jgi:porin
MKSRILPFIFCCCFIHGTLFSQDEGKPSKSPYSFEATYIGDVVTNFSGGIKKGTRYLGLANIRISFDTKVLGLWKGGEFFVNAANAHGGDPSAELIGDYHIISNIETAELTYIHELWYRHSAGNFEITAGLQDLNTDFVSTEYGSMFLNSTFGTPSTIADNVPSPIFPLTAVGISLKWKISDKSTWNIALFDGMPTDFSDNPHNLRWDLNKEEGAFAVMEYHYTGFIGQGLRSSYKAGIYYHSQMTKTDDDLLTPKKLNYNYGIYLIADQMILQNASETGGLGIFGQLAVSPEKINTHYAYAGAGLTYHGLFTKRADDVLGVAFNKTWLNDPSIKDESIIEISYKAQVTGNLFIQPDFQYVINPGGTNQTLKNALAGSVRFGLSF